MKNETTDIVYRCKDCIKHNLCHYYYRRKETSQICKYFELPERKTGKWIDDADDWDKKANKHDYRCTECGKLARCFVAGSEDWWCHNPTNYCPNCGAKMEVDE